MKITDKNVKEANKKKLKICHNKGFHITFKNGWTVSVQFGWGNYADSYNDSVQQVRDFGKYPYASDTAEVWSWNEDSTKHCPQDPLGYQTPEEILKFVNKIARKKNGK